MFLSWNTQCIQQLIPTCILSQENVNLFSWLFVGCKKKNGTTYLTWQPYIFGHLINTFLSALETVLFVSFRYIFSPIPNNILTHYLPLYIESIKMYYNKIADLLCVLTRFNYIQNLTYKTFFFDKNY